MKRTLSYTGESHTQWPPHLELLEREGEQLLALDVVEVEVLEGDLEDGLDAALARVLERGERLVLGLEQARLPEAPQRRLAEARRPQPSSSIAAAAAWTAAWTAACSSWGGATGPAAPDGEEVVEPALGRLGAQPDVVPPLGADRDHAALRLVRQVVPHLEIWPSCAAASSRRVQTQWGAEGGGGGV